MKKTISLLIICLLAIMSLTACGSTNTSELDELRQQVEALETRISELEKTENSVKEPNPTEEATSNSPEMTENSTNSNQQILEFLDVQIKSDNPANWLEIAQCNFATETHLLAIAKKCATLNYYSTYREDKEKQIEIANALSENSATTDAIMTKLVDSEYPNVWEVVACSSKSGENALLAVAKKCATLNYYSTYRKDKEKQIEIANALSENSATTDAIMTKLVDSRYPEVVSIAHQWIEE